MRKRLAVVVLSLILCAALQPAPAAAAEGAEAVDKAAQALAGLLPRNGGAVSVAGIDPSRKPKGVKEVTGYVPDVPVFHPRWRVHVTVGMRPSLR